MYVQWKGCLWIPHQYFRDIISQNALKYKQLNSLKVFKEYLYIVKVYYDLREYKVTTILTLYSWQHNICNPIGRKIDNEI